MTQNRWLNELGEILPADRISTRSADLDAVAHDESSLTAVRPEGVVWPLTSDEVAAIVRVACAHALPLTARGAGTSLEGNPIPLHGGIVVDFSRMSRVLEINPADLSVRVEPGVVYDDLNRELRSHGLFFPPSPGGSADSATIGGMVANNASGIYSVKYGGTRDSVLAVRVVTGSGEILSLGSRCRKTSSGYHLLGLLIGSEGTLGLLTEVTLRLAGIPAARRRVALGFPSERRAVDAIAAMMAGGIDLAAVEFLDRRTVGALNRFRGYGLEERPLLFLETHGSEPVAAEAAATALDVCAEHGATELRLADGQSPWEVRHHATRSIQATNPGAAIVRTDLAAPISLLPEIVDESYRLGDQAGVALYAFGHAGLGILHVLVAERPSDSARWQAALGVKDAVVHFVLSRGGSVSGEHGLGLGNRQYAALEHGATVEFMKGIKKLFDPKGILNPGKIWP
ncbi:MAG: FAD-binding oxidoreductase [Candidatus Binatia bacterium]